MRMHDQRIFLGLKCSFRDFFGWLGLSRDFLGVFKTI